MMMVDDTRQQTVIVNIMCILEWQSKHEGDCYQAN